MSTDAKPGQLRVGEGPTLVLIPGLGSRLEAWSPVVELLTQDRELVLVDLPGFGDAPRLPAGRDPTVDAFTDHIQEFLAVQGIQRPHVAGNSLGGAIALELARRGAAASATALAPIGFWGPFGARYAGFVLRLLQAFARISGPVAARVLRHKPLRAVALAPVVAHGERVPAEVAAADARALADGPNIAEIVPHTTRYRFRRGHELRVPVTIGWGKLDLLLPRRQARRAQALLPQAHHVTVPGAGHVPMSDAPERVAAVLLAGSAVPSRAER